MATREKLRQRKRDIFRYFTLALQLGLVFILIACDGGEDVDVPDPHNPAITSTSVLDIPPSVIASPSGNTLIQKVGSSTWIQASEGMKIKKGDRLKTGNDGTVLLVFFEGSVMEIGVNSEVVVIELDSASDSRSTTVKLKQIVGDTVNRVEKLIDPASLYEVSTPASIASVRGTLFELKVAIDGYTEVTCQEGQLSFTAAGTTVTIEENMTSSASPGEATYSQSA